MASLVYGLSAAYPPSGAVLIPAYKTWGYAKVGESLYKTYSEWRSKGPSATHLKEGAAMGVDLATSNHADRVSQDLVSRLRQTGTIDEIGKQTRVDPIVYSEMMKGSLSVTISHGFGELTRYTIGKVVGA